MSQNLAITDDHFKKSHDNHTITLYTKSKQSQTGKLSQHIFVVLPSTKSSRVCVYFLALNNEFPFTKNEKFREDALHTPTPRMKITIFEGCSLKNRTVPKCHLSPARQKIGQEGWQSQQHWPNLSRALSFLCSSFWTGPQSRRALNARL